MRPGNRARALAALLTTLCAGNAAAGPEPSWRTIREEQGIVVSTEEPPPASLLSFRGRGQLKGSVLHVLAVVIDDARAPEWAKNAQESRLLRSVDANTQLVYSRSHQTWPVKDRDLVMKRTIEVLTPGRAYRVRLTCVPGEMGELPEVVRIGRCESIFTLRQLDPDVTTVEFTTRTEPGGGHNPNWLVRLASRNIPFDTLIGLRKQVAKTRGEYAAVMERWAKLR